jgi:aspartyl-tRNA(Asn)/glutamyl-tRNA(Gln) amidotransferase subunit A
VLAQCIGYTPDGLPLSMQIVGRPFDDATVLRVAHAYEGATPWRARRPVLEPNAAFSTALPPIPAPARPDIDAARHDEIAAACRRAGLTLSERHFQQLCTTAPYVEAMVGRSRCDPEFHEEPASVVCFSDTTS